MTLREVMESEERSEGGGALSDKLSGDWYCPTCEDYVSGESVTFEEIHVVCETFIGENWQKTKAALEAKLSKMEEALENREQLLGFLYRKAYRLGIIGCDAIGLDIEAELGRERLEALAGGEEA